MLCIRRQRDESIVIGDDLVVTVVEIRGERVALAVGHLHSGGRLPMVEQSEPVWLMPNQQLPVGHECVCTVVDVRGDVVRLGIEGPRQVSVHRKEVYDAIVGWKRGHDKDDAAGSPVPR